MAYPPALPRGGVTDATPTPGLHVDEHNLTAEALEALLAELGGVVGGATPRGEFSNLVERLLAADRARAELDRRVADVFEVLSSSAEGTTGDLLNRIDQLRRDTAAADNALASDLSRLKVAHDETRSALGSLSALRSGYASLVARLAARNPAPSIFGSFNFAGTILTADPSIWLSVNVPDPGYPYRLQVYAGLEVGTEGNSTSSRWDPQVWATGGGANDYRLDYGVATSSNIEFHRLFSPVMDTVHTGDCQVQIRINRAYGTARGVVTEFNRECRVQRWRA